MQHVVPLRVCPGSPLRQRGCSPLHTPSIHTQLYTLPVEPPTSPSEPLNDCKSSMSPYRTPWTCSDPPTVTYRETFQCLRQPSKRAPKPKGPLQPLTRTFALTPEPPMGSLEHPTGPLEPWTLQVSSQLLDDPK